MNNPASYIFLSIGLIALWGIGGSISRKRRATAWPSTQATITKSKTSQKKSNKGSTLYYPDISYSFEVHGRAFEGNDIRGKAEGISIESMAQKITDIYPEGSESKVFYNPLKPDDCLLEPGCTKGDYLMLLIPITAISIGIFLLSK